MDGTADGGVRDAGYMCLGESDGSWVLAPAPHGAAFTADTTGALAVPPGTPLPTAAVGRFQLMAALGLDRLSAATKVRNVIVVGSGPVALGAALELHRRGVERIPVQTARPTPPIGRAPGAKCVPTVKAGGVELVLDATGRPERAASLVAPGGTLGLLGTPGDASVLPALAAHRGGWTVVGMHELLPIPDGTYQQTYTDTVSWLSKHVDPRLTASWCRRVPGRLAPQVFGQLNRSERVDEPIVLFDWAP